MPLLSCLLSPTHHSEQLTAVEGLGHVLPHLLTQQVNLGQDEQRVQP